MDEYYKISSDTFLRQPIKRYRGKYNEYILILFTAMQNTNALDCRIAILRTTSLIEFYLQHLYYIGSKTIET